ncbi:MAG: hypothetical protein WBX30_02500, partial [Stellaceae bacterium]
MSLINPARKQPRSRRDRRISSSFRYRRRHNNSQQLAVIWLLLPLHSAHYRLLGAHHAAKFTRVPATNIA